MKNIWIPLALFAILFFGGMLIGWFWCKSTFKPIIITKPGETVTITQWKTNTVTIQKPIIRYVTQVVFKDKPVYVYALVDTTMTNQYVYADFFKENGIVSNDLISFKVDTQDQIKAYADTTFNTTYLVYKQNLRIRDFVYKPGPIQIRPEYLTSKMQFYGNAWLNARKSSDPTNSNVINNDYDFTPALGASLIIGERYKFDVGAELQGFYFGLGIKFLEWK